MTLEEFIEETRTRLEALESARDQIRRLENDLHEARKLYALVEKEALVQKKEKGGK